MSRDATGDFGAFRLLTQGVGLGEPQPKSWRRLTEADLTVFVGLTGVGKTTTLALLARRLAPCLQLPDRRVLTDRIIIDSEPPPPDRLGRFERTRRFAQRHPGGMAAILAAIALDPALAAAPVLFDGLRGEAEVVHAAEALPQARFIALIADNGLRLERLIGRADPFDRLADAPWSAPDADGLLGEAAGLLAPEETARLRQSLAAGRIAPDLLRAKLAILKEELVGYDPIRTLAALGRRAGGRSLVIDTGALDAEGAAERAFAFLEQPLRA